MRTSALEQFFLANLKEPSFALNLGVDDHTSGIQLWFYLPPSEISQDHVAIFTMGLSRRSFQGPCPWIELSFQVPGLHERPQLEKLGMLLGELIYDTLKITEFTPNLLLSHLKRQYMPEMYDMLVAEGAGLRPLWVELEDKTIRVLNLIPLYNDEVPFIRKMGFWNSYRAFVYQKINFAEANRPRLKQAMFYPEEPLAARQVSIYHPPPTDMDIWLDIQRWYKLNAPNIQAADLSEPPAMSGQLEEVFGLGENLKSRNHSSQSNEWIPGHWKRLYAGAYLPTQDKVLHSNPHFIT